MAVLAESGAGWSQEVHIGSPILVVAVYDDAGVDHELVRRAEARAGRLFREAGVEVSWRNPQWEPSLPAADGRETRCHVHIMRRSRALADDIFGVAFLDDKGHGRQADIFYDRIAILSAGGAHDRAVLLGAVIAHELGHLLLGTHSHSTAGIMRGRWDECEVQLASVGLAGFSEEQAERMRERIAGFVPTEQAQSPRQIAMNRTP